MIRPTLDPADDQISRELEDLLWFIRKEMDFWENIPRYQPLPPVSRYQPLPPAPSLCLPATSLCLPATSLCLRSPSPVRFLNPALTSRGVPPSEPSRRGPPSALTSRGVPPSTPSRRGPPSTFPSRGVPPSRPSRRGSTSPSSSLMPLPRLRLRRCRPPVGLRRCTPPDIFFCSLLLAPLHPPYLDSTLFFFLHVVGRLVVDP
ncbi:unnamed protein product [Boreogadus saida]